MIQAQAVPVLSDSQRRVVEALGEGPVKVEAAAGSGKTTAMAALFVAAVERGYPIPQIMAVTFTKRAAAELQRKIALALGGPLAEEAGSALPLDGAWIGTFHALVQRLLHEHAYRVGLPRDLQLLDELGARLVMDETLDEVRAAVVDDGSLLERLPPEPDLRTMSRLVPEAGAAVLRLRSTPLGGDQVAELSRAAYGRWRELGDPEAQLSWHGAALYLLEMVWRNYERRLRERGATDFDGLLRLGLGVLGPGTPLGEWARRHFRLVIVDEYQDTSALQEVLIGQLAGPAQRGLFMVGDARQSIYAFRDAKPGIMAEARGMPLPLFENHRSRWSILRAADQVIRRDPHFAGDPEMEATRGSEPWVPVRVAPAESRLAEAEGIASTLAELHASGLVFPDGSSQGLQWKDMAVLAYTLGSLGPYLEEALRRREIPFQTQSGLLLERPEVKDALAFLRLAADEEDDLAALRCLQVRACRLPDRALMALAPGSGPGRLAISSRLRRHLGAGAPGWEPDWRERGERLLAWVEQIREVARMRPPSAVLALTLELTGIMRLEVARAGRGEPLGNRAQAALWELGQVLRQVEAAGSATSLGTALEELQVLVREARKGEPPPAGDQDQVTLSTIHGAKGLEWPVVLLADCRPYWDHGTPLVLWDREEQAVVCARVGGEHTAAYSRWRSSDQAQVESAERRRLVYVAMTRARDLLIVSSCHRDTGQGEFSELLQVGLEGRPWLSAWPGFGSEAAPADHQAGTSGAIPAPAPTPPPTLSAGMAAARWAELKSLTSPAAGASDPEQLSFSSLQTLSPCPRQDWFRHVARFPDPRDFGTGPGRDLGRGPD
ncbi:MAG: ATP-dependent helicase, partial [Candidatus Dormibacteria bacterium]